MPAVSDLSYDDWLEHAFSHSIRPHGNAWFFDEDPSWWDPEPFLAVDYFTRLFLTTERSLAGFSDAQIAQGFTYLLSTSASGDNGWFYKTSTPTAARLACVEAIEHVFACLFAPRCAAVLGHIDEPGAAPLNTVCYMWWDEFPCLALPDDPDCDLIHRAAIDVMRRTLRLGSIACQEAALHGLGHGARHRPNEVAAAVDEFLGDGRSKRDEIVSYARSARCGCVL
ncbi:hypothetical protein [Sinorhizobium fredii]|uniref:Uncharacterized protein n=1 Tax=Rhizobium fredii TaxID=380 RepID=A0A2A6M3J7_RHIFR|nr:hypothetical protein [Sinorhizobium fredii]ASY69214.1 hypothetical protein SF83666_c17970 [Sinorhizobium fredii CCBAU 83666]PDT49351.1 hypothetical protein CO661_05690 [Sinorhizobium fredii]